MVVIIRHQNIAERVHRNTKGLVKGAIGARAIDPGGIATARQRGHHCTTINRTNSVEGDDGAGRGGGEDSKSTKNNAVKN